MRNIPIAIFAILTALLSTPNNALADTQYADEIVIKNGVRHVTVAETPRLIERRPEIVVIDVRTSREFNNGHIRGAQNIDYFSLTFKKRIKQLDMTTAYLVHCKSGHRSGRAVRIMKNAGIKEIIHMDGGFDAWKKAGLEIARD